MGRWVISPNSLIPSRIIIPLIPSRISILTDQLNSIHRGVQSGESLSHMALHVDFSRLHPLETLGSTPIVYNVKGQLPRHVLMCSPHGELGYNPNHTYPFSDKCPTYTFLDKCHHKLNKLNHRGVRSGKCLRKMQTSILPLSEEGILCHAMSITKVLELHLGLLKTSANFSSVGSYCTNTSLLYNMSQMKWYLISMWFDLS
jgi:hypothetical protein